MKSISLHVLKTASVLCLALSYLQKSVSAIVVWFTCKYSVCCLRVCVCVCEIAKKREEKAKVDVTDVCICVCMCMYKAAFN